MNHEILLLPEVAERLRVSTATVNRLLSLRRKGTGNFPLPVSAFKGKGRWLASDIDGYLESLSNSNRVPPASFAKSEKAKAKEFTERQKRAQQTLERHGIIKGRQR